MVAMREAGLIDLTEYEYTMSHKDSKNPFLLNKAER